MRLSFLALGVLAGLSLQACGFSSGFLRAQDLRQVEYRFDISGQRFVGTVRGSAVIGYILCVIPLGQDSYAAAMDDLYSKVPAGQDIAVLNLREDRTLLSYAVVYCTQRVTISGDIMAFTPAVPSVSHPPSPAPAPESRVTPPHASVPVPPRLPSTDFRPPPASERRAATAQPVPVQSRAAAAELVQPPAKQRHVFAGSRSATEDDESVDDCARIGTPKHVRTRRRCSVELEGRSEFHSRGEVLDFVNIVDGAAVVRDNAGNAGVIACGCLDPE